MNLVLLGVIFIYANAGFAAPKFFTYQGRIINSNGLPLEYSSVSFEFRITNPSGSCVIYREQKSGVDMTNSKGVFDTSIGAGTKLFPSDPSFGLLDAFSNQGTLNCEGGATYTPLVDDGRLLRVQFHDGSGWKIITPDNVIRSVPYAGFSAQSADAKMISGQTVDQLVLKTGIPICSAGYVLTSTSAGILSCVADTGGASGVVNSIAGTLPISASDNGSGAYTISASIGTTAGTLAAGNDSRIVNAMQTGAAASGDLSGTFPGPTVAKIANVGLSFSSLTTGQFLQYNGTNWINSGISLTGDITGAIDSTVVSKIQGVTVTAATPALNQLLKFDGAQWSPMSLSGSDLPAGTLSGSGTTGYVPYYSGVSTLANSPLAVSGGKVGIGTAAPAAHLDVAGLSTATSGEALSLNSYLTANPASASSVDYLNYVGVGPATGNAQNFTGVMSGILPQVYHDGTGTLTYGRGVSSWVTKNSTGPITNAYSLYGRIENKNATGAITNAYGLYIDSYVRTGTITNSYGVYVADTISRNYFAGNVGIGVTNPTYKLDVSGDLRITGTPYRASGDIAWQVPSDARLKDVTGSYDHGLNDLLQLKMIRFRYKNDNPIGADTSKEYVGVLAQNVEEVIPEAVTKDPKTGFLSLNTTPIFWSMIKAIQDLNVRLITENQKLKEQSDLQAQELREIKNRLEAVEKLLQSK